MFVHPIPKIFVIHPKAAWVHSLWSPSASLLITLYRAGLNSQKSPLSQSPPRTSGVCDLIWELFKLFPLIDGWTRSTFLFTSRETYNIAETAFSQQEGPWGSFCSSSTLRHLFHCSRGESFGGAVIYGNIWWNSWWRQQKWCLKHLYVSTSWNKSCYYLKHQWARQHSNDTVGSESTNPEDLHTLDIRELFPCPQPVFLNPLLMLKASVFCYSV